MMRGDSHQIVNIVTPPAAPVPPAGRRSARCQRECAAIEARQAPPRSRARGRSPAWSRPACGRAAPPVRAGRRSAPAVIVDDDSNRPAGRLGTLFQHLDRDARLRPLAGIVDKLPTISSRSGRSPRNRASSGCSTSTAMSLVAGGSSPWCARAQSTTGATSVTVPTTVSARRHARALEMARDLVAHDLGLLPNLLRQADPPPRADASFTMTESGVFSACARLPTWVRARSTISRLASISALVFTRERRDLDREIAFQPLGMCRSGSRRGCRKSA